MTFLVTTIAYAEYHYVAFVALNVLKVLYEETFQPVLLEEMLVFRLFFQTLFNRLFDRFHLGYAESHDPESFLRMFLEMLKNQFDDSFSLFRIISQSSSVVNCILDVK